MDNRDPIDSSIQGRRLWNHPTSITGYHGGYVFFVKIYHDISCLISFFKYCYVFVYSKQSQSYHHPNQQPPQLQQQQQQARFSARRSGGRKLPATPTQPSTLNIDKLAHRENDTDPIHVVQPRTTTAAATLGSDLFNFPRLETSPTRMKNLLQGISLKGLSHQTISNAAAVLPASEQHNLVRRNLPIRQSATSSNITTNNNGGRWNRNLQTPAADENSQISFEEAVIAGRGTRQLPVVGPQQLMQQSSVAAAAGGRGRGLHSLRRELPRPGNSTANNSMAFSMRHTRPPGDGNFPIYVDSEEEDWC